MPQVAHGPMPEDGMRLKSGDARGSSPRVRLGEGRSQAFGADVRVSLGGSERRVAEYLLDGPQIRAAVQKMRGRGMPQIVRRYVGNTRARCEPVDRLAERARIKPPASRAEEQRPVGTHKELRPRRKIRG